MHVTDELTRESLSDLVGRRDTDTLWRTSIGSRLSSASHPIRPHDNYPEPTAKAFRDPCHFSKTRTSYIEPGSPHGSSLAALVAETSSKVELFVSLLAVQAPCRRLARGVTWIVPNPPWALARRVELEESSRTNQLSAH